MTISQQADQIVERYRPYASPFGEKFLGIDGGTKQQTINATLCGIKEVEARIEEHRVYCLDVSAISVEMTEKWINNDNELTAILNELKSRL